MKSKEAAMATVSLRPAQEPILDEPLYEIENGRRVEPLPMGAYETLVASGLLGYLIQYCQKKKFGRAVNEMLFDLVAVNRHRRPDVAIVSYKRWPRARRVPSTEAWEVIPDLAVEIVSRTNTAAEALKKLREYFRAGVRLVWLIFPDPGEVHVYKAPKTVLILDRNDVLRGEPVLPGFRLAVSDLFE
jgi:Uma2 family endonuclease